MSFKTKLSLVQLMLERKPVITKHVYQCSLSNMSFNFAACRLDKLGFYISGNKILKIAPNLQEYLSSTQEEIPIATFGGSHSNHIRAFSAVTRALRLNSLVFLRESPNGHHIPLKDLAASKGCKVVLLSPEEYKHRENTAFINNLKSQHGHFCLMTEGGTSPSSVKHLSNVFSQMETSEFDHSIVPVGMGGTIAGLASGMGSKVLVIGISSVKADKSLNHRVRTALIDAALHDHCNWGISYDYHFGGFGKAKPELTEFAVGFEQQTGIELNQTYTMKSAFAMIDLMRKGKVSNVLWVNTYNPN